MRMIISNLPERPERGRYELSLRRKRGDRRLVRLFLPRQRRLGRDRGVPERAQGVRRLGRDRRYRRIPAHERRAGRRRGQHALRGYGATRWFATNAGVVTGGRWRRSAGGARRRRRGTWRCAVSAARSETKFISGVGHPEELGVGADRQAPPPRELARDPAARAARRSRTPRRSGLELAARLAVGELGVDGLDDYAPHFAKFSCENIDRRRVEVVGAPHAELVEGADPAVDTTKIGQRMWKRNALCSKGVP